MQGFSGRLCLDCSCMDCKGFQGGCALTVLVWIARVFRAVVPWLFLYGLQGFSGWLCLDCSCMVCKGFHSGFTLTVHVLIARVFMAVSPWLFLHGLQGFSWWFHLDCSCMDCKGFRGDCTNRGCGEKYRLAVRKVSWLALIPGCRRLTLLCWCSPFHSRRSNPTLPPLEHNGRVPYRARCDWAAASFARREVIK